MKYVKNFILILLMLILTLTLFLFGTFTLVRANLTNPDFYIRLADRAQERSGLYDRIYEDAQKTFAYRGILSSLPDEVFDGVLTKEYTVTAVKDYIRAVIADELDSFSLWEMKQTVLERCRAYVAENSVNIADSELVDFCDFLDTEMINAMKLPFFAKIYPTVALVFGGAAQWIVPVLSAVVLAGAAVGIYFLSEKRVLCLLRRLASVLIGSTLMMGVSGIFLQTLSSSAVFSFSTDIVLYYLDELKRYFVLGYICFAMLYLICGLILAAIYICKKRKEVQNENTGY